MFFVHYRYLQPPHQEFLPYASSDALLYLLLQRVVICRYRNSKNQRWHNYVGLGGPELLQSLITLSDQYNKKVVFGSGQ